jgi:phenylalanine-4-hydroxylase
MSLAGFRGIAAAAGLQWVSRHAVASTRERVPAHLRRFVVEQDYDAYTAVDQAVWRFVLLQMYDRLRTAAHPAYARGLQRTGMSVERIPRIAEMDACLGEFGWGAVCVDGFIPPRAFQEFQALGILPIAADMRTVEHLPYTPAPDVIHEAAGHAPILPDPEYAAFLRRIGECGVRAFASAHDADMYNAIYRLSVVKEQRDASPDEVADAEHRLAELVARGAPASEAAKLSRLYWWTAEYGLIGTPSDYRLYGAGLLSSLGESHFCHDPAVRKLPIDARCAELDYDVTRPQPQLFVTREFAELHEVLDRVCAGFAFRTGGVSGLRTAQAAAEVATIELDSGIEITGVVAAYAADGDLVRSIVLSGESALAERGRILSGHDRRAYPHGLEVVLGTRAAARHPAAGSRSQSSEELTPVVHLGAARIVSVRAGASDARYWPEADYSGVKAPMRARESARRRALRSLYERARSANGDAAQTAHAMSDVETALEGEYPDEWLLRWNVLERLTHLDREPALRARLASELWRLEQHYRGQHPIAMGLRYLGYAEPAAATPSASAPR